MKKSIIIGVLVVAVIGGGAYLYQNYRGAWPAISKPPANIADIINQNSNSSGTNTSGQGGQPDATPSGENKTKFPLKLPDGFAISVFAGSLDGARVLAQDPHGNMLVSLTSQGRVLALTDRDQDGKAETPIILADGLNRPHGLAVKCLDACKLYVAETDRVSVFDYTLQPLRAVGKKKIIDLPKAGRHFTRTLMFLPPPNDKKMLISVGSSCDVCNESDWRHAKILIADEDGSNLREYAGGLRNAVFMATSPVDKKTWATEMGRDFLGDELPPDEINIVEEGKNYGWPICYGKNIHDDQFDKNTYIRNPCMAPFETSSHIDLPAHSAPLGLAFVPTEGWPSEYHGDMLVAFHGSWNRSQPTGYKITRLKLDAKGHLEGMEDFISGWLQGNGALGRPVDILIQSDGAMFVSDDKAGVVYKITHKSHRRKSDLIKVNKPKPGETVSSPLVVEGVARGYWFFEASFPVKLVGPDGKDIAVGHSQSLSEWMTEDYVPFRAILEFPQPSVEKATLILERDNASGLPQYDDHIAIPVLLKKK